MDTNETEYLSNLKHVWHNSYHMGLLHLCLANIQKQQQLGMITNCGENVKSGSYLLFEQRKISSTT